MTAQSHITLRHSTTADEPLLRRLGELDSKHLPGGPFLVAEVGGELQAALSLRDGTVAADPFRPTLHLVELLRSHAAAQASAERRRRIGLRRRPRLAFAP